MYRAGEAITQKSRGPRNDGGAEQSMQKPRRKPLGESWLASSVGLAEAEAGVECGQDAGCEADH